MFVRGNCTSSKRDLSQKGMAKAFSKNGLGEVNELGWRIANQVSKEVKITSLGIKNLFFNPKLEGNLKNKKNLLERERDLDLLSVF